MATIPEQLHGIKAKVEIRSNRESNLLHGKLYHIDDGKREHADELHTGPCRAQNSRLS